MAVIMKIKNSEALISCNFISCFSHSVQRLKLPKTFIGTTSVAVYRSRQEQPQDWPESSDFISMFSESHSTWTSPSPIIDRLWWFDGEWEMVTSERDIIESNRSRIGILPFRNRKCQKREANRQIFILTLGIQWIRKRRNDMSKDRNGVASWPGLVFGLVVAKHSSYYFINYLVIS